MTLLALYHEADGGRDAEEEGAEVVDVVDTDGSYFNKPTWWFLPLDRFWQWFFPPEEEPTDPSIPRPVGVVEDCLATNSEAIDKCKGCCAENYSRAGAVGVLATTGNADKAKVGSRAVAFGAAATGGMTILWMANRNTAAMNCTKSGCIRQCENGTGECWPKCRTFGGTSTPI